MSMKTKEHVKLSETGVARTTGFAVRGFSQAQARTADPNSGGSALQKRRNKPGMSMKTKGRVKLSGTGVVRTAGFEVRGFSQAHARAADPNSGGLRYENEGKNRECL